MNTINGKPTGDIVSCGAGAASSLSDTGRYTIDMTFDELEALWRKVRPDGRRRQDWRRNDED